MAADGSVGRFGLCGAASPAEASSDATSGQQWRNQWPAVAQPVASSDATMGQQWRNQWPAVAVLWPCCLVARAVKIFAVVLTFV